MAETLAEGTHAQAQFDQPRRDGNRAERDIETGVHQLPKLEKVPAKTQAGNEILEAMWIKQQELVHVLCSGNYRSRQNRRNDKNMVVRQIENLASAYRAIEGFDH